MKIKITTKAGPWLDNRALGEGEEVEVDAATGAIFIEKGFAEEVKVAAFKRAKVSADV